MVCFGFLQKVLSNTTTRFVLHPSVNKTQRCLRHCLCVTGQESHVHLAPSVSDVSSPEPNPGTEDPRLFFWLHVWTHQGQISVSDKLLLKEGNVFTGFFSYTCRNTLMPKK